MPKSKSPRKRKPGKPPPKLTERTKTLSSNLAIWLSASKFVLTLVLGAATLLGYLALRPRLSASLDTPIDPHAPFYAHVILVNEGNVSLCNVEVASYIRSLVLDGDTFNNDIVEKLVEVSRDLEPTDRKTIVLGGYLHTGPNSQISNGDLAIVVHYKVSLFPFHTFIKAFRFVISHNEDGTYRVDQQPGDGVESEYENLIKSSDFP